jgi:hypothetical protein
MSQKAIHSIILLVLIFILSACSALPALTGTSTADASANTTSSIVNKLGIGLLKLEETGYAVSASQAKDLLPLWKAVRAMGADRNASQVEVEALYAQIQESLSADQIQYITALDLTSSEISSLAQKYTVQTSQDYPASQSAATQPTRTASNSSSTGGGPGGGPGGDLGGGPGGFPGVELLGAASASTSSTQTTAQSLAKATAAARSSSVVSSAVNVQLASSIIQLLEKRMSA